MYLATVDWLTETPKFLKLPVNTGRTPQRIRGGELADQGAYVG
jgi:hypothetical protein